MMGKIIPWRGSYTPPPIQSAKGRPDLEVEVARRHGVREFRLAYLCARRHYLLSLPEGHPDRRRFFEGNEYQELLRLLVGGGSQ